MQGNNQIAKNSQIQVHLAQVQPIVYQADPGNVNPPNIFGIGLLISLLISALICIFYRDW